MIKLFSRTNAPDPLTTKLRVQAQAFDPAPSADLHRKIMTTLAQAEAKPRVARNSLVALLLTTGTLAAAVIALVLFLQRNPGNKSHPTPEYPRWIAITPPTSANPMTLAIQYVDDPLQNEVDNLLSDLSRASTTVTNVFPGVSKRQAKPTTQKPAV